MHLLQTHIVPAYEVTQGFNAVFLTYSTEQLILLAKNIGILLVSLS